MDFFKVKLRKTKTGLQAYPDFIVGHHKDLMIRGREIYAVWDEEAGFWKTSAYDIVRLVDREVERYAEERSRFEEGDISVLRLTSGETNLYKNFKSLIREMADDYVQLDSSVIFADTPVTRETYATRTLPYRLENEPCDSWDELVGTLYSPKEREKIEWAIGSVVAGRSKYIQKFFVFYGEPGTGKSTILNIIQDLFDGYTAPFTSSALGSANAPFATAAFRTNPVVAIEHDGDLSRLKDNARFNSIVSHEEILVEEKFKAAYPLRVNSLLMVGTNQPVHISDSKSGLLRRLIDINPSRDLLSPDRYNRLMGRIKFEHGAIARRCLSIFLDKGENYYGGYRPIEMMYQTDPFMNFMQANLDVWRDQDYASLKQIYALYKEFCHETGINNVAPMYAVRKWVSPYFKEYHDRKMIDGVRLYSVYSGFDPKKFFDERFDADDFTLDYEGNSIFDEAMANQPAQYANDREWPERPWRMVDTTLSDLDTSKTHYVQIPEDIVVIDFDIKGVDGEKSQQKNLEAAASWPPTYTEFSKGGAGVHLHYRYSGDVRKLAQAHSPGVEVKTLLGAAALRRRLTRHNNLPIADIAQGTLPEKEEDVLTDKRIKSEKGLRNLIERNLRKEIHPGTKPSIDFIKKILDDAVKQGLEFDVTDLRPRVGAFALNSTNQSFTCLKIVQTMQWASEGSDVHVHECGCPDCQAATDDRLVFFDVEVYPNLLVVCWKYEGDKNVIEMINPTSNEIEALTRLKLVGFNNRRYDNHVLYARHMGYDNKSLYQLSQKIINNQGNPYFGAAYGLSYADIYDFSSKKQGLKKFQIELGIKHVEMDIPWDRDVPEDRVADVVRYCSNDVVATEKVFEARKADFTARKILADISGLSVGATTRQHTEKIIFGKDPKPQSEFVYTDLSKEFPGYVYDSGKSTYRGEVVGEGGYVSAEPGFYENVGVLDVASMHPTSIEVLKVFGPYTKAYSELKQARLAIKHGDLVGARKLLGGKLRPHLEDESLAEDLSFALKIVINIVYGLTSAKFDNKFRDVRNKDNIVAKRGALFMLDLKYACLEKGWTPIHIKTDSIKLADISPEKIEFVTEFGKKYGYDFEHETTYDTFCLVNDAVYVARAGDKWTAVGLQFQRPYVFKTLFSHEEILWKDLCETKQVTKGSIQLENTEDPDDLIFVGRTGSFVPVKDGYGGRRMVRVTDDKRYAVVGTKGYLWLESQIAKELHGPECIDESYFEKIADDAIKTIELYAQSFNSL